MRSCSVLATPEQSELRWGYVAIVSSESENNEPGCLLVFCFLGSALIGTVVPLGFLYMLSLFFEEVPKIILLFLEPVCLYLAWRSCRLFWADVPPAGGKNIDMKDI